MVIDRGDVVLVSLEPVVGSEVGKTRPAVVVQNRLANESSPTVTVVPISGRSGPVPPFQVAIPAGEGGLSKASRALCEQIRTISRQRITRKMGSLAPARLLEIRAAIDRHLWF